MLKPFPPFVASLHVTVRIEPLARAIDEEAAFEKLTSGLESGALEAVRGTCWKGYCITIDKVPPAPAPGAEKAWVDPDIIPPPRPDRTAAIKRAIQEELIRQHKRSGSSFMLSALSDHPEHALTCDALTVQGRLDIADLAQVICGATAF